MSRPLMEALTRREFLGVATGTVLASGRLAPARPRQAPGPAGQNSQADALFDRSVVFDALSADQEWDQATFEAVRVSGLSAIPTSLGNRDLAAGMRDLEEWDARFAKHSDRLLKATSGTAFAEAKKKGTVTELRRVLREYPRSPVEGDERRERNTKSPTTRTTTTTATQAKRFDM